MSWGYMSAGYVSQGVYVQGVSVQGGICPGGKCPAIWELLDKDDLRASHELLNTERILQISQIGVEI